ncbi:MAG: helix-turn-helix transcriptional regulator, partial [Atopobiaceae bacterium]|nr:helix-turn-helix transcriptional regulator [Atopobiaceae bacterium]
ALTSPQLEDNDLIRSTFGAVLKRYREKAGYSQRSFARAVGISNSHLRKIESGETSPSLITVYRLSAVLDRPVTDIIIEMDGNIQKRR